MSVHPKHLHEVAKPIFTVDVCITSGDDVLMFKRSPTKKVFPGWLALPGGHIDEGENPLSAAIREVQEEVAVHLTPNDIQLTFVAMHHHIDHGEMFIVFGFLAKVAQKPKHLVSNSEGEALWINRDTLMAMDTVFPPVKHYFPHILGGVSGVMYNYSIWENSQLVRIMSEEIDANS